MFPNSCHVSLCRTRRFVFALVVIATPVGTLLAQTQAGNTVAGRQITLPVVPQRDPRSVVGPAAADQWMTQRGDADRPVASFLEPLEGTDAAIEVIVGQGRLLTIKQPLAEGRGTAFIAAGDPTVIDFEVLPNPQLIRITGKRAGVTDLSVTTAGGETYSFEVHVVYDTMLLTAQLKQAFPDAHLKLGQMREHVVIEGQARSAAQVQQILLMLQAYLESVQVPSSVGGGQSANDRGAGPPRAQGPVPLPATDANGAPQANAADEGWMADSEQGGRPSTNASFAAPRIINLMRVPGTYQVMLQVKIAELNRTGLREIGADLGFADGNGNIVGSKIGGAAVSALGLLGPAGVSGVGTVASGSTTTGFGIFPSADFQIFLRALRQNSLLTILAEPNLVAMSGHEASFLAGGQFPVPVPQVTGGVANSITVQFKDFGVQLNFLPFVLDDEVVRLSVTPEVSSIDFSLGTTLIVGGEPIPGLNTRRATTTVELRQGQTLAIAGLLQVQIDARTERIPGLGDLPYIGPMFSNTSHQRVEKELLVLVTPHLVAPMRCDEVPPLPGSDIMDPGDLEFYLHNRIEGRTGRPHRSTTNWDDPQVRLLKLEKRNLCGAAGFSDCQ